MTEEPILTRAVVVRPSVVRAIVYGIAGFQVLQAATIPVSGFLKSYWVVDYDHGFVRRGLLGAMLRAISGSPTDRTLVVATCVLAGLGVVALMCVAEVLIRAGSPRSCALAILLVSSPFGVDYVVFQRRPDQLGLVMLVALGMGLRRFREQSFRLCLVVGVCFAVLMFAHEGILFEALPFAMLLVVVVARDAGEGGGNPVMSSVLALAVPAVAAGVFIAIFGTASSQTVAALKASANGVPLGPTNALDYLDDSVGTSLRLVADQSRGTQLACIVVGTVLAAVHLSWLRAADVVARVRLRAAAIAVRRAVIVIAVSAVAILFAVGIDWMRWFACVGCALLVVVSFGLLAQENATDAVPSRELSMRPLVLLGGLYLAALTPLPDSVLSGEILRALLPW
ncbi:MAG: hypothetical protein QOH79_2410 [Acidimicrobiaceae bacterium]